MTLNYIEKDQVYVDIWVYVECDGRHFTGLGPIEKNLMQSDHLYPMMKHVNPDGSGLYEDDNALIHRAQ